MKIEALIKAYESLTPESLPDLIRLYTEDCEFRDPFNDIRGHKDLSRLFEKMFELEAPRFVIVECISGDNKAFLSWNFHFVMLGKQRVIHGGTLLHFATDGRVSRHRDYWDAAEELYEKIPLLGGIIRLVKKAF